MPRRKPRLLELEWRTTLRLSEEMGEDIERRAALLTMPAATLCRQLLMKGLDQLILEERLRTERAS